MLTTAPAATAAPAPVVHHTTTHHVHHKPADAATDTTTTKEDANFEIFGMKIPRWTIFAALAGAGYLAMKWKEKHDKTNEKLEANGLGKMPGMVAGALAG